jgi:probable F420-dependent oxidoreductase
MRVGCDLPYYEDPGEIRAFCDGVEAIGFHHLGFSEHVVSAAATPYPPGFAPDDPWHETATLLGFLAAVTRRVELNPSMWLLPLRPAALAAKQAAEIALLTGDRLRIGVSAGWNTQEMRALGVDPRTRGARLEEQVAVMRALWTQDTVDFDGRFERLDGASLHPRPARPIPVWMGGGNFAAGGALPTVVVDRMARVADGYKMFAPLSFDLDAAADSITRLRAAVAAAGRDPATFGIEARLAPQAVPEDEWVGRVEHWAALGVSHLGLANRKGAGGVDVELERLRRFADVTRHHWSPA